MTLECFDYARVRLLPGRFQVQVDQARELYGGISNDSILKGFRRQAGLPAPGEDMKGWASSSSAGIFGQLISGMVRLGIATDDAGLRAKAVALFEGWRETIPEDGNAHMRAYDWDKLVCGLVDLYLYLGAEEALPVLRKTTEWAARTFDRTRPAADDHDFWGAGPGLTSEWYTLPENLYRAYLATGDAAFRSLADVWLYHDYWEPFAHAAVREPIRTVHAYSHVNSLSSAAAAYLVTGEDRYLRICRNAYDFLQRTQVYATGGYGPDERLMRADGSLGRSLECCAYHAEIPCGAWAAFKLCRYLIGFTGEARYGDWIETTLINALAASLPPKVPKCCCPSVASTASSSIPRWCTRRARRRAAANFLYGIANAAPTWSPWSFIEKQVDARSAHQVGREHGRVLTGLSGGVDSERRGSRSCTGRSAIS